MFSKILATYLVLFRRFLFLAVYPYRTMRKIILEKSGYEPQPIFALILVYYFLIGFIERRPVYPSLIFFLFNFFLAVLFFPLILRLFGQKRPIREFFFGFSYALLPILTWLYFNGAVYVLFPPPHVFSFPGLIFSFFYLIIFLTIFLWEVILMYLTVRFAVQKNFFTIILLFIIYILILVPANIFLNELVKFVD